MEPAEAQINPINSMHDVDLIFLLRKAGGIWFKDTDLLLLEELIHRYQRTMLTKEDMALALPSQPPIE
jgi:hypothetical protein